MMINNIQKLSYNPPKRQKKGTNNNQETVKIDSDQEKVNKLHKIEYFFFLTQRKNRACINFKLFSRFCWFYSFMIGYQI